LTFVVQFGRVGFGLDGPPVHAVRLGLVRLGWCRGWLWDALARTRAALALARQELRR